MQSQPQSQPGSLPAKRTVSLAVAIILIIVAAGVGVGATYAALTLNRPTTIALCNSGQTITIGELLDLSGSLSDQGKKAQDSSTLAVKDINAALVASNCNLKFAISVDDYAHDNAKALSGLQTFAASGISVVVGPLNSAAALYILDYANTHHIVLISPSSTSPTLAIPNDIRPETLSRDPSVGSKANAWSQERRGAACASPPCRSKNALSYSMYARAWRGSRRDWRRLSSPTARFPNW